MGRAVLQQDAPGLDEATPEETFAFSDDRRMLELMLEPAPEPRDVEDEDDGRRRESLRSERSRGGYSSVGVVGKSEHNNGTLWRSAWQLGCAFTFTVGARFAKTSADTTKVWTSLPAYDYEDFNAFAAASPRAAAWIAVEMGGTPLADFAHPDRAVYILGSEDNGLPSSVLRACAHHVSLPIASADRTSSFNVAVTGAALVLHDRLQKRRRRDRSDGRAAVREDALRGGRAGVDAPNHRRS